jgi:hypothetical protein
MSTMRERDMAGTLAALADALGRLGHGESPVVRHAVDLAAKVAAEREERGTAPAGAAKVEAADGELARLRAIAEAALRHHGARDNATVMEAKCDLMGLLGLWTPEFIASLRESVAWKRGKAA